MVAKFAKNSESPSFNPRPGFDVKKMLGFTAKKLLLLQRRCTVHKAVVLHHHSSKAFLSSASIESDLKGDAFTISYLVNSCGVAVNPAKRISNYLHLKSAEKPARTLSFFKTCGFTDAQISRIVRVMPRVLLADPVKTLKPKFDLFASLGASRDTVLEIISKCPRILLASVENKMLPALNCLKSVVGSEVEVLNLLAGAYQTLMLPPGNSLEHNVALLRGIGMPDSRIWKFILVNRYSPLTAHDRFKPVIERALAMGFDPKKHNFGDAINSFATITEANWERKVMIFKKWGWSDGDFSMAFKKQPRMMVVSEKKIHQVLDYLVNTMGIEASVVAGCPNILMYSLEKRIIPRCSVVQVLASKGRMEKSEYHISYVITVTDEDFLAVFVKRHNEETQAELMNLYSKLMTKDIGKPTSSTQWLGNSRKSGPRRS